MEQTIEPVQVLPITEEQKSEQTAKTETLFLRELSPEDFIDERQYQMHGEGEGEYPILAEKDIEKDMALRNTSRREYKPFETIVPDVALSQAQLNSIPDKINGFEISEEAKKTLYRDDSDREHGGSIQISNDSVAMTISLDKKNNVLLREVLEGGPELTDGPVMSNEVEFKNQPVKVVGLTLAQQEDFSKHVDGQMFSDLPKHDSPTITKEQLDSIPDIIDGIEIDETDKIKLYTGNGVDEGLKFEGTGVTYSIDSNSNLTRETLVVNEDDHEDISSVTSLVLSNEVQFKSNVAVIQEVPITSKEEIKIIPLTKEQIQQFKTDGSLNPSENQLNSIPDKILGVDISTENKKELYTNTIAQKTAVVISNGPFNSPIFELKIDSDNTLNKDVYLGFGQVQEGKSNVLKSETQFLEAAKVENQSLSPNLEIAELKASLAQMPKDDFKLLSDKIIEFNSPGESVVWDKNKPDLSIHEFSIVPETNIGIKTDGGKDLKERHSMPIADFANILREIENTNKQQTSIKTENPLSEKPLVAPETINEKAVKVENSFEADMKNYSSNLFASMMAKSSSESLSQKTGVKI